jgi:hypothetical protein
MIAEVSDTASERSDPAQKTLGASPSRTIESRRTQFGARASVNCQRQPINSSWEFMEGLPLFCLARQNRPVSSTPDVPKYSNDPVHQNFLAARRLL